MSDSSKPRLTFTDQEVDSHFKRLHTTLFDKYDLSEVVRYIQDKTYLNGDRFSFKDHEFQETILSDTSKNVNVQKCAQVGMSEAMARYALAVCRIIPYFSTIFTMPFSGDAANFVKTRMDPVISESPDLAESLDPELNNSEIKGISTSLLYARGTTGTTAALSVPADMLIHDEVDRSDPHTLAQYQSRLKHSSWKLTRKFGTPTLNGIGIAAEMAVSRRKRDLCRCNHCNHWFAPNYHEHVIIPGWDKSKREINKHNLGRIDWQNAYLACPRCGAEPSLARDHREWVIENTDDNFDPVGYYITPFSVPNVVSIPSLVYESTRYKTWAEYCNQALGETSSDNNDQLLDSDVQQCKFHGSLDSSNLHCMGIDMGQVCHIVIGRETPDGILLVVHREKVPIDQLEVRYRILKAQYRVITSVMDWQPYTDTVLRLQKQDITLYGAVYTDIKRAPLFSIKTVEENLREGKLAMLQTFVQRNLNFDELMYRFKNRRVLWTAKGDSEDDLFVSQCLDMKRKPAFDRNQEMTYVWVKSHDGSDHYMHALGYLGIATALAPTASGKAVMPTGLPLLHTFRVKVATNQEVLHFAKKA